MPDDVDISIIQVRLVGRPLEERQLSQHAAEGAEAEVADAFPEGFMGVSAHGLLMVSEARAGLGAGEGW